MGAWNSAVNGAADIGRTMALIRAVIASFVFAIVFFIGAYLVTRKKSYTSKTTGTITRADCKMSPTQRPGGPEVPSCVLDLNYVAGGSTFSPINIVTMGQTYQVGQTESIVYDPNHPADYSLNPVPQTALGMWMMIISAMIVTVVWVWYVVVSRSRGAAALSGAGNVAGFVKNVF